MEQEEESKVAEDFSMEMEESELYPEDAGSLGEEGEDDGGEEGSQQAGGQGAKKLCRPHQALWRLRVCPIQFEDFCRLKDDFRSILKLSCSTEYRMSQHLASKLETGVWARSSEDLDLPWLPNEKIYTKPQNAATAGMLEMRMVNQNVVTVMRLLRSLRTNKRVRMRFELKLVTPRGKAKDPQQHDPPSEQEGKAEGDGTPPTEVKTEEGTEKEPFGRKTHAMTVNFAVRQNPVKLPAFSHEPGHTLTEKDKQIFLSNVPDAVPDNILEAILLSTLTSRQKAEDGSGTAVFTTVSPLGAQGYMELFDGILVNGNDVPMATTLGTLHDAKKQHSVDQEEKREANEQQIQGVKRKPDRAPSEEHQQNQQAAKKARGDSGEGEGEDPQQVVARMWLKSRNLARAGARGMRGIPRGQPSPRTIAPNARGTRRSFLERDPQEDGVRGRGRGRGGGMGRGGGRRGGGMERGGRGGMERGGRGGPRGMSPRGGLERGGRGGQVYVRGGGGRGRPSPGGRGRGGFRARGAARGSGMPRDGYSGLYNMEAEAMAAERELDMVREQSLMAERMGRDAPFPPDHYSMGEGGYPPNMDFPPPRRRW